MYIGILTMDDWHIANGIHCPSLKTFTARTLDKLIKKLYPQVKDCEIYCYEQEYQMCIKDRDDLEEVIRHSYSTRIAIEKPREGYLKVINTDDTSDVFQESSSYEIAGACFEGRLNVVGKYWFQLDIVGKDIPVRYYGKSIKQGHVYQLLDVKFDVNNNASTYLFEVCFDEGATSIFVEVEQTLQFSPTETIEGCICRCYTF